MISAIVATYGRLELLKRTLPTVLHQDLPARDYEVVVVIDGPDAGTARWLRSLPTNDCKLSVVEQKHLGLAAARNAGVRKASGDVVLFLDDDLLCAPNLARSHAEAHRRGPIVALGPVPVSSESPRTIASEWVSRSTAERTARLTASAPASPRDIAVCANSSLARELFLSCGGFDESLVGACEEFDLGIRLKAAGVEFRFVPDADASEIYVKSADAMVQNDCPARGRNEVRLCRKHPEYRAASPLAGFDQGATTTRVLRYAATRAPFSVEPILAPIFHAAEAVSNYRAGAGIATRMLEFRRGNAFFRSAIREAGAWQAFQREFAMTLPVLLYHHVGQTQPGAYPMLTVSPARFESQMKWLRSRGYSAIKSSDWISWRRGDHSLPSKPILITFDDGYADLAKFALPILNRLGFTGTVFLPTQYVGKSNLWDSGTWAQLPLMNEAEIREWAGRGIEFGSHSRTHPDLRTLSREQLDVEIVASARDFESITGSRPTAFAYPYGAFSTGARDSVSQAFAISFTTEHGVNHIGDDPFILRRLEVHPTDNLLTFATMLACGFRPIAQLRRRLALRSHLEAAMRLIYNPTRPLPPA